MDKIELGQVAHTATVHNQTRQDAAFNKHCWDCLNRHKNKDFGDIPEEDKELNLLALGPEGGRIFSVYNDQKFPTIWIITEWDRKNTTILFPNDY